MSYHTMGCYFDDKYQRIIMSSERKLFPCRKDVGAKYLKYSYPPCSHKLGHFLTTWLPDCNYLEVYFKVIMEDIRKRHPDKVMEAYLLAE